MRPFSPAESRSYGPRSMCADLDFTPEASEKKILRVKWQRSIKKYCENTNLCQVNGKYETSM